MSTKPTFPSTWPGLMPADALQAPIAPSLLNPQWQYTPANKTDVQRTWARFGWKPVQK